MSYSRSLSLRKTLIAGAIGVTVLGLTAQPTYAAENIFQQVQQTLAGQFEKLYLQLIPGEKPGKLVLKQVSMAAQNLKSFEGKTTIDVEGKSATQTLGTGSLTFSGPTVMGKIWDLKSYKQDLQVTGSLSYEGKTYDATANVRMVDGVTYVQVTKLPDLAGANIKDLQNTWVKFEPVQASASATPTVSAEQQARIQAAFYKMLNDSQVSPAKVEKKDGNDVYVFTATLSKPAVAEYLATVRQIEADSFAKTDTPVPEMTPANTEKMLANVGEITATFWIDKASFYPRHMELPLVIQVKGAAEDPSMKAKLPSTLPVNAVETVSLRITSDMSKFNQLFTITAPENAEDSRVFFTKVMGIFMPGLTGMGRGVTPSMMPSSSLLPMMSPKPGAAGYRMPTVGTTELPTMTPEQKKALEQYEQMMKNYPKSP